MAKINLNQLMDDIVHINNQITGLNLLLKNKKAIIATYFKKSGNRRIDGDEVTAYEQSRTNIKYDVPAIMAKLPKDTYSQFIERNYSISDWEGFVALCKKHGISGKQLRPFVTIQYSVDQNKLNKLYDHGKVSLSDLDGCYEATVTKSIALKFKNIEGEIPIT